MSEMLPQWEGASITAQNFHNGIMDPDTESFEVYFYPKYFI